MEMVRKNLRHRNRVGYERRPYNQIIVCAFISGGGQAVRVASVRDMLVGSQLAQPCCVHFGSPKHSSTTVTVFRHMVPLTCITYKEGVTQIKSTDGTCLTPWKGVRERP